jgi:hypothetical protein
LSIDAKGNAIMKLLNRRIPVAIMFGLVLALAPCGGASGQVMDNPGFKALPRPVHYATALVPEGGAKAVIVYGKDAPWTQTAATAVQKAILDWSGVKLELADDRTVTSEDTWLLNDAYRRTPLVVLGNARDNRVMHALGVNYLLHSNRSWPGGDRYFIRSVFEPFAADVNYVLLEASTGAGMDAACVKFAELLKTFGDEAKATATIPPRLRVIGSVKDKWEARSPGWTDRPAEWAGMGDRSVAEMIAAFKGKPILAGTPAWSVMSDICRYAVGGDHSWTPLPARIDLDLGNQKAIAAMTLLGCRALGGRAYDRHGDHYGGLGSIIGIRAVFNAAVLSPEELTELESCIILSGTAPDDYLYGNVGGEIGWSSMAGRHGLAVLLTQLYQLDYAMNHCRMDDKTRQEVERRYDAARRSTARFARSFRDNEDGWWGDCLGEDTLMQVSCVLHQGMMDNVRNGNLRRSADMYVMYSDNLTTDWGVNGCYVGLSGFTSSPGGLYTSFMGGGLVDEAAFYYDDPMYRWLARNWSTVKWSRGGGYISFYNDAAGESVKPEVPSNYDGVKALPYDERLYAVLKDPRFHSGSTWTIGEEDFRLPQESFEKAADCVAFRDGFDPRQAYLFLATSQPMQLSKYAHNNSIARYTDLGDLWLFTNTTSPSSWSRNLMSISNGKTYIPHAGCTVEALSNVGEVSAVTSKEEGVAGNDWSRTVVHLRGHYFVVLDRMQAREEDDYAYVCRWRTTQLASLQKGVWVATAPDGNVMRIQNTDPILQTSEYWENDGAARPYVLQQYQQAKLSKGQARTCQNLIYVSGASRPDEFEARRVGPEAMLVRGQTAAAGGQAGSKANHLALIGTGSRVPDTGFYTDGAFRDAPADTIYITGLTRLSVKDKDSLATREILWTSRVVDLRLDSRTGKGELEIGEGPSVQIKRGETWTEGKSGRQEITFAKTDTLHVALVGAGEQIPLAGFQTDARIYDVFGEKLHLAGVTTLRARIGGEMREILWAPQPMNALVDLQSGKGEIEVTGAHSLRVKIAGTWSDQKPGRQAAVFAQAGALPKVDDLLEAMWDQAKAPADSEPRPGGSGPSSEPRPGGSGPLTSVRGSQAFQETPTSLTFKRPLRRLTNAGLTSTPHWGHNDVEWFYWDNTDNLEITLSLPQSAQVGCLRLVGIMKRSQPVVGRFATQGEAWGSIGKYNEAGDFKFSLVLSDDGFQKDIRKIDSPSVNFEETVEFAKQHGTMDRLPTWRIQVGQKAKQIKIVPRSTTKERPRLILRDLEVYEAQPVNELAAKAIAAEINGDGANELVVGTSEKELAAFDADGKVLWHKDCPGDIIKLDAADLDESGKFQTLVLLGTERLLRLEADGSERPGGDLYEAQRQVYYGCAGATGVTSLSVWGPDDPKKKEVILHSCGPFRMLADGSMKVIPKCMGFEQASARLVNMYPGEPEVLATIDCMGTYIWSGHHDADGNYVRLGSVALTGFDGSERGGFGYVHPVDVPAFKGVVSAIPSGIGAYPIAAFMPGAKEKGWTFSTSGVPAVAALVEDIGGAGVPQVFLARNDGFVNILRLSDGSSLGLLNLGEPILGMVALKGRDGKAMLAVGTTFGVRLFAPDPAGTGLKEVGRNIFRVPAAAFAGPGGKDHDRLYIVGTDGQVTVLSLK